MERFFTNKSCKSSFHQLDKAAFLNEKQTILKDQLQKYCLKKITIWESLLDNFRQNKKTLLIERTLKENGILLGYIKALPYRLFDWHNKTPTGISLNAKLDRIQNAILEKDLEGVLNLMQDLTIQEQLSFISVFNEANNLVDFHKSLEGDL